MNNAKIIYRVLGTLLFIEAILLLVCLALGLGYGEKDWQTFGLPALLATVLAGLFKTRGRNAENRMSRRDGYLIVSLTWVVFSIVGMLPFIVSGHETRIAAAFFESMSGFTTTGASIFNNIDALPHSILFWRSIMHWLGGMGIVFFTIAVLPTMGTGDLKLFSAEATGLKIGKLHARISTTARWLWGLYILLTGTCTAALYLGGMDLFDAVNHGLSTVSTGGFSTHQDSIGWFHSATIEYIEIVFMFVCSINFTLLYLFIIKRRWRDVFRDSELRCFLILCSFVTLYTAGILFFTEDYSLEQSLRYAAFHTIALQSTSGFTSCDFMVWHPSTWMLLFFVSAIGACAGSTSGGIKCVRILTAYKMMVGEFRHILHPRAVIPIRINRTPLSEDVSHTIFAYFVTFFLLIFASAVAMMCMGLPILDSVSLGIASFSNVGPSIGYVVSPLDSWSHLPDAALWINSFLMLAGRLEIFSLLLPFVPAFWRDN